MVPSSNVNTLKTHFIYTLIRHNIKVPGSFNVMVNTVQHGKILMLAVIDSCQTHSTLQLAGYGAA